MNKIKTIVTAIGIFLALPIVQGFAADQQIIGRAATLNSAVNQGGVIAPRPPVLTQTVFFICEKGTCTCKNSSDCGEMGRLGVCKAGTFKDGTNGGGSCTMKST